MDALPRVTVVDTSPRVAGFVFGFVVCFFTVVAGFVVVFSILFLLVLFAS